MTDDDLAARLRPATAEDWPAFVRAMSGVFNEEPSGPFLDTPSPVAELDRSLGLFDGDRVAATAGIYSLAMTVPGDRVVPTAGITWITVSPTHRRQGVLTAIMRRQLDEVHEQGREPVAALWAAESSIYGRFGYAPATWRGGWTGQTERLRLRRDVSTGPGRVRMVDVEEYRAAAVGIHDTVRRFVPGNLARDDRWWDRQVRDDPDQRHGYTARRFVLHTEPDGTATGYASYRVKSSWNDTSEPEGTLRVGEVRATTPPAYAALWQYLLSHDLVRTVSAPMASADDPVRHLLADFRALHARRSTRSGCGWSTSAGRCRPGATRRRSTSSSRSATTSARGTPAAGTSGGIQRARSATARTATPTSCSASRSCRRSTWVGSRWPRCRRAGRVRRSVRGR